MIQFLLYAVTALLLTGAGIGMWKGVRQIWHVAGQADYSKLTSDSYMNEGCKEFKKGRGAWVWRMLQLCIVRGHYARPGKVIKRFQEEHPHIGLTKFVKVKGGARHKLTRPGAFVYISEVRLDERTLTKPKADSLQQPKVSTLWVDGRGFVLREELIDFAPDDLEALSQEEQAHIDEAYKQPFPDLSPFADGQIVEVIPNSLLAEYHDDTLFTENITEALRGVVDVPDVQSGSNLNSINEAKSKPRMMYGKGTWKVYNLATRRVATRRTKKVGVRRALCGPEYQVFVPTRKRFLTLDRIQLQKREYDKTMLGRVVLDEGVRSKVLAWAPLKDPQKLESWGVGTGLLQGKGNIMLLAGPLGVGKTILAEAMAEYHGMPFYTFDAAELGTTPAALETGLKQALARAKRWGALVLWDEAEPHIEERSSGDRESNALVAVSLRHIESFEGGMLVIATNRPFVIDDGINSRIPVKAVLPAHSVKSRKEVWRNHLPDEFPTDPLPLGDEDLTRLATVKIDGRQVRHAVLLAARRAASEDLPSVPVQYLYEAAEQVRKDATALRDMKPDDWETDRRHISIQRGSE